MDVLPLKITVSPTQIVVSEATIIGFGPKKVPVPPQFIVKPEVQSALLINMA